MGGTLSPSNSPAVPAHACPACAERFKERQELVRKARDRAAFIKAHPGYVVSAVPPSTAEQAANRLELYNKAVIRARAAQGAYDPNKPIEGLTNLSANPERMNAQLGLPPGTLKAENFVDAKNGFQSVLYRSDYDDANILAFKGTDPQSLTDWRTNIDNGIGKDTAEYKGARSLSSKLYQSDVKFDIAGHSKGGGLATEAGIRSPDSQVYTFNSAGILQSTAGRTVSDADWQSLANRTNTFQSPGEFLTGLQSDKNPQDQIANAQWLREQLSQDNVISPWHPFSSPIAITNVGDGQQHTAADFASQKSAFISQLDANIASNQQKLNQGQSIDMFRSTIGKAYLLGPQEAFKPGLPSLAKHLMTPTILASGVIKQMEDAKAQDKKTLESYLAAPMFHRAG